MTPLEGDRMRRAFSHRNSIRLVAKWKDDFIQRSVARGVPQDAAEKIFGKFHGLYQFPEAHAYAFGITAYQMSWLKHYFPLEFFVAIFNNQPMGFYNLETLKEDAKRHDIVTLPPDVNLSDEWASIENGAMRMGLRHVHGMTKPNAEVVVATRDRFGKFESLADFMYRTGVQQKVLDNLTAAGAFDCLQKGSQPVPVSRDSGQGSFSFGSEPRGNQPEVSTDRRSLAWESGLRYRPVNEQHVLPW
jgi:error-prone DNA polymerase